MEDELLYRYYYYLCNCESIITNLILNIIKENTNENDSVYLAGLKIILNQKNLLKINVIETTGYFLKFFIYTIF